MVVFAILDPSSVVIILHLQNILDHISGTILMTVPYMKIKFLERLWVIFHLHTFCSTKDQVRRQFITFFVFFTDFSLWNFEGSKQDNLIPLLSRKCRAFALNNDKMSEDHNNEEEDLNNKVGNAVGVSEDLDFEASKPDLSQIIRSLDTPPPSS